jgi:hypothetical protein
LLYLVILHNNRVYLKLKAIGELETTKEKEMAGGRGIAYSQNETGVAPHLSGQLPAVHPSASLWNPVFVIHTLRV